jgi:hypothetical protein
MRYATQHEIEYLGSLDSAAECDPTLVDELRQRLDALRRFDQYFSDSDRRPRAADARWQPDSPFRWL